MFLKILMGIFVVALVCCVILLLISSGEIEQFVDKNGLILEKSIAEKVWIEINGCEQGMIIRGENENNPILLFVHGGPGMPEYFLSQEYRTELEKYFTVCYWEQRGASLSYDIETSPVDITVSQLVDDTVEVTKYLSERFGQNKIYLMGHSWGTFIGIQAAAKYPDAYNAYIGMSQISNTVRSEIIAYNYMVKQYVYSGNMSKVNEFKKYNVNDDPSILREYMESALRDNSMHELGIGTMHNMRSVITGIFLPVMKCEAYTLLEKINLWRAKSFLESSTNLREEMLATDLGNVVTKLKIPVYIFAGSYDYTVNYDLQKTYFDMINAPIKGFYTFKNSAHSPLWEEPEKAIEILKEDILNGTVNFSD